MDRQQQLPFALAEASYADRKKSLAMALNRQPRDPALAKFVLAVFDLTSGGVRGEVVKSYKELSDSPLLVWSSYSKTRKTVEAAVGIGLVEAIEQRYVSGGQRANAYRICWPGVREILGLTTQRADAPTEQPPAPTEQPPAPTEQPYKEYNNSYEDSLQETGTGPEAGAGPMDFWQDRTDGDEGLEGRSVSPRVEQGSAVGIAVLPAPVATRPRPRGVEASEWRSVSPVAVLPAPHVEQAVLLDQIPELLAARDSLVSPLPANRLVYGLWASIEERHLRSAASMLNWHRRQLSLPQPAMGNTQADFLLTVASALYALAIPDASIKRSRVAVFVNVVSRQDWRKVLWKIPAARADVDRLIERDGSEVFSCVEWPPAKSAGRQARGAGRDGERV